MWKSRDRYGDLWKYYYQVCFLSFTYPPVFTINSALESVNEQDKMRMAEAKFHIPGTKVSVSHVSSLTTCNAKAFLEETAIVYCPNLRKSPIFGGTQ